jgi:hypothetical protein
MRLFFVPSVNCISSLIYYLSCKKGFNLRLRSLLVTLFKACTHIFNTISQTIVNFYMAFHEVVLHMEVFALRVLKMLNLPWTFNTLGTVNCTANVCMVSIGTTSFYLTLTCMHSIADSIGSRFYLVCASIGAFSLHY